MCSSSAPRVGPLRSCSPGCGCGPSEIRRARCGEFGAEHRFVADYLSSEVLAALDDDSRGFLQGVAVLGEFTPSLCDDVLDRTDSAAQLAELERSNLFVSRLGGGWFRIHSLLAEYAKAQLAAVEPDAPARIHRRAAEWLRSRGSPVRAVEQAAAAGDHELVAQLLTEYHLPLIRSGAGRTLMRWVRTLPEDRIVEHPELALAFHGMTLTRTAGNTALTGRVRDQSELNGLLQRVKDFGLTLLELRTIDDGPKQWLGPARAAANRSTAGPGGRS